MTTSRKRLGDLLLSLRLLTPEQLERALHAQRENPAPLGTVLVQLGFISENLLLNALAAQIGVYPWRLEEQPAEPKALAKVPADICRSHQVLPVSLRGDLLLLAMVNPHDIDALDAVRNTTGLRVEPVLADAERLFKALESIHGARRLNENLDELVEKALQDFNVSHAKSHHTVEKITEEESRPVVGLVNQLLTDAIRMKASDVHVEPRLDRVEIRFRIDGQLQKVREIPQSLLPMLTTRLKIMAELDIVEFRVPQDGRVTVTVDGRQVDVRVSVIPNYHGQRLVLRILDKVVGLKKLEEIGFQPHNLDLFRSLVKKPYGMFLVTGPTGSGKTTTLYAALAELKNSFTNVMTCEDPIEYDIDGVNQSQVNDKVGLTFAKQLRAILRQDPDVILVGEIRDGETAETAIRAALTGHMVLSTLHCNDAPSAIPRLMDMGVDPFLLSTSVIGVMSQRLLRQLCEVCKDEYPTTPAEEALFEAYGQRPPAHMWRPVGCECCEQTGYRGRSAIQEIMPITPGVAHLVAEHQPLDAICGEAKMAGYEPLALRALEMAGRGETSLEEASRVVFLDPMVGKSVPLPLLRAAA